VRAALSDDTVSEKQEENRFRMPQISYYPPCFQTKERSIKSTVVAFSFSLEG
jgi:hypothetical protein